MASARDPHKTALWGFLFACLPFLSSNRCTVHRVFAQSLLWGVDAAALVYM
jgi:hypothetical protein